MVKCAPPTLDVVIISIAQRVGMDPAKIDVSALAGIPVNGLVLSGLYNGGDAIDALRRAFFFDPVEVDGRIVMVPRGRDAVATITAEDLVEAPEDQRRGQALEFPRKLHLDYQNSEIGYAPAKATAARSSADVRVVGELSLEVPVVLSSDEAAQVADKLLKTTWADAEGEITFAVGDNFLRLTPTDNIELSLRGAVRRVRINKIERSAGVLQITGAIDRQSAYTSGATGPILRAPTQPPRSSVGPSTLAIMDIPALVDTNDQLGMYFAVTGESTAWAGAQIQISTDAGASFAPLVTIRRACRVGTLLNAVTAALEGSVDATNAIEVDFGDLNPEIPSWSEAQWLSERGALAILRADGSAELVQYRDAVASTVTPGVWTLSPLIRGRLGSGATAHAAGVRVVYLEDAEFVQLGSAFIGQSLRFRAVSVGDVPLGASFDQTTTFAGRSQRELPADQLAASNNGSGIITASWVRRDRFGTDVAPIASTNWTGYRVTFAAVTSAVVETTATAITYDASGLGGGPVTVSVAQINRITGSGPIISEIA